MTMKLIGGEWFDVSKKRKARAPVGNALRKRGYTMPMSAVMLWTDAEIASVVSWLNGSAEMPSVISRKYSR